MIVTRSRQSDRLERARLRDIARKRMAGLPQHQQHQPILVPPSNPPSDSDVPNLPSPAQNPTLTNPSDVPDPIPPIPSISSINPNRFIDPNLSDPALLAQQQQQAELEREQQEQLALQRQQQEQDEQEERQLMRQGLAELLAREKRAR